ncbi:response regulator transcription factor [Nocardiopsis sp. YSL2]|uniref:response regulator n=1 Tax=Nocardiopsis sp. YSL2 TaxID=2939492 RepID=UPI0026F47524|nr:response regulator transcription factor [Nocardiopsis sp. YSL2]
MNGSPIRVVVCEDDELVRAGYAAVLDAQPDMVVVGQAGDGSEAVSIIRDLRPDVAVMDIHMPRLNGIEVTARLAESQDTHPIRVLMVTTFNLDEYVYDALRAGASGFLLKDAPLHELIAGVRTVARGEALLAPSVTRRLIGEYALRIRPADPAPPAARLGPLTEREHEVLLLIAEGLSNGEIAERMTIAHETVKTHVSRILTKLRLRDRVQAVVFAYRSGLVRQG